MKINVNQLKFIEINRNSKLQSKKHLHFYQSKFINKKKKIPQKLYLKKGSKQKNFKDKIRVKLIICIYKINSSKNLEKATI